MKTTFSVVTVGIVSSISFLFGIGLYTLCNERFALHTILCGGICIFVLSYILWNTIQSSYETKETILILIVSLLLFIIGVIRAYEDNIVRETSRYTIYKTVRETMYEVDSEPIIKNGIQNIKLKSLKKGDAIRVLLKEKSNHSFSIGDVLTFKKGVKVSIPKSFEGQSGKQFDYNRFLEMDSIFLIVESNNQIQEYYNYKRSYIDDVIVKIRNSIYLYKVKLYYNIDNVLTYPHSSLVKGMVYGDKSGLDDVITTSFNISGISHITVISGYNIALVMFVIHSAVRITNHKRLALIISNLAVWLFIVFVGMEAPVVRAGIMVSTVTLSSLFYRKVSKVRIILYSICIMVWNSPLILFYNPSFQLSVLALIGVVYVSKGVKKVLSTTPMHIASFGWLKSNTITEVLSITVGAQIMVTPIIISISGYLSLVSPITNILITPLIPIIMLCGSMVSITHQTGWFTNILVFVTEWCTGILLFVAEYFSHLEYSILKIKTDMISIIQVISLLIGCFFIWYGYRDEMRKHSNQDYQRKI